MHIKYVVGFDQAFSPRTGIERKATTLSAEEARNRPVPSQGLHQAGVTEGRLAQVARIATHNINQAPSSNLNFFSPMQVALNH